MLVPLAQIVAENELWSKEASPDEALYAIKGCAEASTNFAQMSIVPDAYEVLLACPNTTDVNQLWGKVGWAALQAAGWKTSVFPTYGTASRSFVKFYVYPNDSPNGCWAYITLLKVRDVLGVTGYCDELESGVTSLPQIKAGAEHWAQDVVVRVESQLPPTQL
jgi:hypothetical protein